MRIAYGVHGYGRGHASRALAVLPELKRKHDLLILAGGDGYELLRADYAVQRIPTLRYYYGNGNKCSLYTSTIRNIPCLLDIEWCGPGLGSVCETLAEFAPDVVISDAEFWTHRAAKRLGIPRISFDHFGIMAFCKHTTPALDRPRMFMDSWGYLKMIGRPERVIISSFYTADAKRPGVSVVGPVLRSEVLRTTPVAGEHILVYLNQGRNQFTPQMERTLKALNRPVKIYGPVPRKRHDNLTFCPLSNLPFVEDLASCHALISTAGNQLIGEAIYFGKPVLVIPEDTVEQRLNAAAVVRLGIGISVGLELISAEGVRAFLKNHDIYRANIRHVVQDGWLQATAIIENFIHELTASKVRHPQEIEAAAARMKEVAIA